MGRLALVLAVLASSALQAADPIDLAVLNVLSQSDRSLTQLKIWRRVPVTEEMDLVLAIGAPNSSPELSLHFWWSERRKLGLFLQERNQPHRVFSLAIASGHPECAARVLRATVTDTVIACGGEKSEIHPNQKFVYDVRARRLVRHFSYEPLKMYRAPSAVGVAQPDRATFRGGNSTQQVVVDFVPDRVPEFRLSSRTESPSTGASSMFRGVDVPKFIAPPRFGPSGAFSLIEVQDSQVDMSLELVVREHVGGRSRLHRLPRSTYDVFANARPERVKNGYGPESTLVDRIGPWQMDGGTLWFGKAFYDGEGISGVGGFGYFDANQRTYRLFTSPAVAALSVSAIFVEQDAVWLALASQGEYGQSGGGVVQFDRTSETFRHFEIGEGVGFQFVRAGGRLLLATDAGITVLYQNDVKQYFIDRTTDGRLRAAAADK